MNNPVVPLAPPRKRHRLTWLLLALLALVVSVAFSPAYHASFVDLDDQEYVFGNTLILRGLSVEGAAYAVTARTSGMWVPLTRLSLLMDAEVSNNYLDPPPADALPHAFVYHVSNVALHALAACMLFLLFQRATGLRWQSFAVALLWAIHPLRVESVAWVTERKDVLSGLFGFLSLYLYVLWCQRRGFFWYGAAFVALVLSLMAKATFVTAPFLMLLLDYWPLKRWHTLRGLRKVAAEKLPFFLLGIGHAMLAAYVARRITSQDVGHILNGVVNYARYFWMQVDVTRLAPFYPYVSPNGWAAACAAAGILLITALFLAMRRRAPWLATGWLWYLIAGVPVVGLVHAFSQGYADRFTYLPSVGIIALAVFALPESLFQGKRLALSLPPLALIAGLLATLTFRQSGLWHDSLTLFSYSRDVTPPNELVHRCMATAYRREGKLDDAHRELTMAIQIDPTSTAALLALAYLDLHRQEFGEAIEAVDKALPLISGTAMEREQRAEAYLLQGRAYLKMGKKVEAIDRFQKSLQTMPDDAGARAGLAEAQSL